MTQCHSVPSWMFESVYRCLTRRISPSKRMDMTDTAMHRTTDPLLKVFVAVRMWVLSWMGGGMEGIGRSVLSCIGLSSVFFGSGG